ncbi:Type I restriction enzyme EcoKI M protein [Anaerohalosphaera lusitana]|uniref:site-specific DNA-methyltransferase (adenine-specific) n=1 Tax=Anaerohalosphaera lusitana TaxID=1936003 RepID=A0A1U9NQU2_9BACT|nr:type I restriction-modification system subunit M [Anaerohalosphaera lusitana]AQT70088.1 Type I restriction enzyme EcoKI M protein [Anaerohalosphaera lusitana]
MALKKSQLYSSLWSSCDELRGGMDASQYKDYILTLLFMKYVSDKYANDPDALIEVPQGGSFDDMVALKGDKEIGDKINKIIGRLAEANELKGVIDQADFNDESKLGGGKEMQDRLSRLVAIFDGLDFRSNRAEGDDLLGDAYEYLMRNFATESGKSKGQFYTPAEVSRIMASIIGIGPQTMQKHTVYDPTCGSGSLLIKAADHAPKGISIYGQEMDNATWALARMNMFLHNHPMADLWRGNTLASPHFKDGDGGLKKFDFAVANPPFSAKSWTSGFDPANDQFGRFEYGIPPAKNGDYAFLLHLITSLRSKGKGAIILPHGVLFRGNKEADIRRKLIKRGLIRGIIGLPANLFYGTGIPACIIMIDKEDCQLRESIFMIDASKGFIKDGNKNRLREQDIHRIVDVFNRAAEIPRYSRMVPLDEIASEANDYNLNIPRYIDSSEPEDVHDLDAHLNGGIPNRDIDELSEYWDVFPTVRKALFKRNGRPGYSEPRLEPAQVKTAILEHPEFTEYADKVRSIFRKWHRKHRPMLMDLDAGAKPRDVISTLSEDLLERFKQLSLIDPYDMYQRLMDYWFDTMQDDIYLIAADGWKDAAQPRGIIDDKKRKIKETPDLTVKRKKYKMDLLPPDLLIERFFTVEKGILEDMQAEHETASRQLEEFIEENTVEEGPLEDATNDKGKVTKGGITARLKEIKEDPEAADERRALNKCKKLMNADSTAAKAVKDTRAQLDEKVLAKYPELTEDEIKTLAVEDKWFASIRRAVDSELDRLTQTLAGRVKELEQRYAEPLPDIFNQVATLTKKVDVHLDKMGVSVNG